MTSTVNHKSNDTIDFVGILECLIDIGRNVAHEYELTAVWAAHAPAFQTYLKDLKECASTDDSNEDEAVEECYGVAAYREFMNLLKEVWKIKTKANSIFPKHSIDFLCFHS